MLVYQDSRASNKFFTVYKRVRLYRVKKDLELVSDINNIFSPDAGGKRISCFPIRSDIGVTRKLILW